MIGLLGLVFATPIAVAVGASGESLAPTAVYIGAMFAFTPLYVACFALEQVVRAEGAAVASMTGVIASTIANLATTSENLSASRSRIRDADYAKETAEMTRTQILQQAGTAMLSQANSSTQNVLSLLR